MAANSANQPYPIEPPGLAQRGVVPRARLDAEAFITKRGLRLPRQVGFDTWLIIGGHLSSIYSCSAWCLGDWLAYGEDVFSGRYREAVEMTSLNYQTLRNYAWVVRRFPLSRRRDNLSFGHHLEVAALSEPEQDFWLRKAEELAWSVKRLRREVRMSLRERFSDSSALGTAASPGEQDHDRVTLRVPIPAEHLEACRAAASRLGLGVDEWAGQVLIHAALPPDIAVKRIAASQSS